MIPTPPLVEIPQRIDYSILPFRLSPGKRDYYILISEHGSSTPTHLLHVHQAGARLATTRHLFAIYTVPDQAKIIDDIISELVYTNSYERRPRKPIINGFTRPIIFHDINATIEESKRIVKTELENWKLICISSNISTRTVARQARTFWMNWNYHCSTLHVNIARIALHSNFVQFNIS